MIEGKGFTNKVIVSNLKGKMAELRKTLPEDMHKDFDDNFIISGGAITSLLLGQEPNDYDVYFRTTDFALKLAQHYLSMYNVNNKKISRISVEKRLDKEGIKIAIKSAGVLGDTSDDMKNYEYFEGQPVEDASNFTENLVKASKNPPKTYKPIMITDNAISLSDKVQLILRFCGDPNKIHENYDFEHCKNWYTNEEGLVLREKSVRYTLSKELKYSSSKYPLCALFRTRKFIKRGWSVSASEMMKIVWEIRNLNLNNIEVLKDQLIGVDQAYFDEVIEILEKWKKENPGKELEETYLFSVLDKVFEEEYSN